MPRMPSDLIGAFHILFTGREKTMEKVNSASCFHGLFSLTDFYSKHSKALHGITEMSRATRLMDLYILQSPASWSASHLFFTSFSASPFSHPSIHLSHQSIHPTIKCLLSTYQLPGIVQFSSVQSVVSNPLQPHGLQHTRPPCPSPTHRVYSNSCPLSRWCHPTISSSVIPFSSCLQYLSQHQGLFKWVSSSNQVDKVLEFQL